MRDLTFVDSTIPEGTVIDGVHVRDIPGDLKWTFRKYTERCPNGQTAVSVWWVDRLRWLLSPQDVMLHMAPTRPGILRRRVFRS